jgi:hypothetical protein
MADPRQNVQGDPNAEAGSGLGTEIQGVASAYDFLWRAGTQITQAVGNTVSARRDRKSFVQAQKSYLGPWTDLAFYDENRNKRPVLKADRFRKYLEETDGKLKPNGPCLARAEWAQFVHALGIEPQKAVLTWKSPAPSSLGPPGPVTTIETDGEVLCHIVNLFGELPDNWGTIVIDASLHKLASVNVSFACITWTSLMESLSCTFRLDDDDQICKSRVPLGLVSELMEPNTLILKHYYNAMYSIHGSSDSEYACSDPSRPLYERIQDLHLIWTKLEELGSNSNPYSFYEYMEEERKAPRPGMIQKPPRTFEQHLEEDVFPQFAGGNGKERLSRLYCQYLKRAKGRTQCAILTWRWLKQANRVWRRATSGDGQDARFLEDVYHAIHTSSEIQEKVKQSAEEEERAAAEQGREPRSPEFTIRGVMSKLRAGFLFNEDAGFCIKILIRRGPRASPDRRPNLHEYWAARLVQEVLESYGTDVKHSQDSWKQELYAARSEVFYLWGSSKVLNCKGNYVRFLHFNPDSALWNKVCQLAPES